MTLCQNDFVACSEALHRLYEPGTVQEFPGRLLPLLSQLVPAEHVSYNDFDTRRHRSLFHSYPARPGPESLALLFDRHFPADPLSEPFQQATPPWMPVSDHVSLRHLHLGTEHQMILSLRAEATRQVGLALSRSSPDFSERDRSVVGFLAPHIARAYRNALAASGVTDCLTQVGVGLGAMRRAVLLAERDGTIRWGCDLALEWLKEFFPDHVESSGALPPRLKEWLRTTEQAAVPGRPCFAEYHTPAVTAARLLIYCGRTGDSGFVIALVRERNGFNPDLLKILS